MGSPAIEPDTSRSSRQGQRGSGLSAKSSVPNGFWSTAHLSEGLLAHGSASLAAAASIYQPINPLANSIHSKTLTSYPPSPYNLLMGKQMSRSLTSGKESQETASQPERPHQKTRRAQLGLTGAELAERANISASYVSLIENGAKVPDEEVRLRARARPRR